MSLVYDELRRMAGGLMARGDGRTLQPTALVHEAWMKLAGGLDAIENRRHFFATAALAMRSVLADHAKAQRRQKRGGGAARVTLFDVSDGASEMDLIALHECLERLASLNADHARIVELRVFGGLTIEECAAEMGVSARTVSNGWRVARAWLWRELFGEC